MIQFGDKSILIVAPHPDDEAVAAGGLIARAKSEGASVFVLFLTVGSTAQYGSSSVLDVRLGEVRRVAEELRVDAYDVLYGDEHHLGLDMLPRKELVDAIESRSAVSLDAVRPDIVVMPGASYNQDHNAAFRACVSALRPYPGDLKHTPGLVLSYSHIDEVYWNTTHSLGRAPNFWVDISAWTAHKRRALGCYQSQMKSHLNHWRTVANIQLINRVSGMRAGVSSAEEFLLLRCFV